MKTLCYVASACSPSKVLEFVQSDLANGSYCFAPNPRGKSAAKRFAREHKTITYCVKVVVEPVNDL